MRYLIVLILFFVSSIYGFAQTAKPIKWKISISKTEIKQGESVEIIMNAEIQPGWYLYSSDFDPNLGPTVTSILFDVDDSYQLVKGLIPFGAKEKYDSLWEGKVRYFVNTALLKQEIKILGKNPVIKARLYYQVCNDKIGKCIPYEEEIFFDNLKVLEATIPTNEIPTIEKNNLEVKVAPKTDIKVDQSDSVRVSEVPKEKLSIEELEIEKSKLVKKNNQGKDLVVEQLKEFTKKYG